MRSLPLKMLWKEKNNARGVIITIATTLSVSIVLLQFFYNPNINYLINIFQDTIDKKGYEAIDYQQILQFFDGMYKGAMILILLIIFISLIMYSCNYYNKINSRIIGLLMISGYSTSDVLVYQMKQMSIISLISYILALIASVIIIPVTQAIAYNYIGVNENIFFYAPSAFIISFPLMLLILVFIAMLQTSYSIRAVIPNLLKNDSVISFKKRKKNSIFSNLIYILFFGLGTIAIYISKLDQALVFPALLYIYGAYGIGTAIVPIFLEKKIGLDRTSAITGLVYSNYILDIQQMKSIILMFIMSISILSTMLCTNLKDYQYTILFQLGYILTNIVLSFTIVNRCKINQINKKHYYNNLRRLGLMYNEVISASKREIRMFFSTIIILVLIYTINLIVIFVYLEKMNQLFGIILILEFVIPIIIAYKIVVYSEGECIKNGYDN